MRRLRWLIIALFFLPWYASEAVAPAIAIEDASGSWRRTRDGWQRIELLWPEVSYRRPALHPLVVGSLEILLTMTAMLVLAREFRAEHSADQQEGTCAPKGPQQISPG